MATILAGLKVLDMTEGMAGSLRLGLNVVYLVQQSQVVIVGGLLHPLQLSAQPIDLG